MTAHRWRCDHHSSVPWNRVSPPPAASAGSRFPGFPWRLSPRSGRVVGNCDVVLWVIYWFDLFNEFYIETGSWCTFL